MYQNNLHGLVVIIGGIILLVLTAGELLIRLVFAFIALAMINYGLRLRGDPPLIIFFQQIRNLFWF